MRKPVNFGIVKSEFEIVANLIWQPTYKRGS
ncbi:hypothetical protein X564_17115 [Pseudoalteromonas agarivorans]|nr:hypothetical protein X564_17115 [Pseudoalteromonas agarivorans]